MQEAAVSEAENKLGIGTRVSLEQGLFPVANIKIGIAVLMTIPLICRWRD